jgi:hypothetical protein
MRDEFDKEYPLNFRVAIKIELNPSFLMLCIPAYKVKIMMR